MFCTIILFTLFLSDEVIRAEMGPQEVVKKYYSADLGGARLSGDTYKANISPLITWKEEPGWDIVFVTKRVYISKTQKTAGGKTSIEVRYDNIGILGGGFGKDANFFEIEFTEVITFILVQHGTKWLIKEPVFYPHVSPKTLIKQFEISIAAEKEKDTERVQHLNNILYRLKELK
jgi:hypothetical protein